MKTNLVFTGHHFERIKKHLFPGDGMEALAFCLATMVSTDEGGQRLLVNEVIEIPHEVCERSADYITWKTEDIVEILNRADREKKTVVKVHSHPGGLRAFSCQDDRSDLGLFPSIFEWCEESVLHASLVVTEDFVVGRTIDSKNQMTAIQNIWVVGDVLQVFPASLARQGALGFDESTYEVFRGLRAAVIGCSGTGSWVMELLGRNEVGALLGCDHDILEKKNLNRVLNSKLKLCGLNKAILAIEAVQEMGLQTRARALAFPIHSNKAVQVLKGYDVVFGCTDSVFARHLLSTICAYYMIPYFDIGVHISAKKDRLASAVSGFEYLFPGGSSLQTRGVFTAEDLANETYQLRSPNLFDRLQREGYLRGRKVARPAVVAINSLGAGLCFEEFQARVLRYRDEPEEPLASKIYCAKSGEIFTHTESDYAVDKILKAKVGLGDVFFEKEAHLLFGDEKELMEAQLG